MAEKKVKLGTPTPAQNPHKTWVQTQRAAHEVWARICREHGSAAALMHILVANLDKQNAVVVNQKTLAKMAGLSERTVRNALTVLKNEKFIEVIRLNGPGTVNAYVVNDRVVWTDKRDNLHLSLFSASIIADAEFQEPNAIGDTSKLRQLPWIGELQVPYGDGEPPVSQRLLDGMEPDLPAITTPAGE